MTNKCNSTDWNTNLIKISLFLIIFISACTNKKMYKESFMYMDTYSEVKVYGISKKKSEETKGEKNGMLFRIRIHLFKRRLRHVRIPTRWTPRQAGRPHHAPHPLYHDPPQRLSGVHHPVRGRRHSLPVHQ